MIWGEMTWGETTVGARLPVTCYDIIVLLIQSEPNNFVKYVTIVTNFYLNCFLCYSWHIMV